MYAKVIPETKTKGGEGFFCYSVPDEMSDIIRIGNVVNIPFGKRHIRGLVIELPEQIIGSYKTKDIHSIIPDFLLAQPYIETIKWISEYYLCSLGEALEMFLPPEMKRPKISKTIEPKIKSDAIKKLSIDQQEIFEVLLTQLQAVGRKKPALIHGVTGSGKTEVYIKLTEEALKLGLQVIVLVPEIILTPQTVQRFEDVFGENIALMHSQLSRSEKYNCYWDFYNGTKKILIGPRSALMVPSSHLGLIIVDEEQEDAFKQEQNPRYHAVELATKIAALTGSLLVLGSATPRIETYFRAKSGEFNLFEIASRFERDEMPKSTIIDLKNEIRGGNLSPISLKLQEKIAQVLANKKQVLLFLNRRGMSTFVSCRDCGEVINCPNCLIPLVYHVNSYESKLNCHHCDHKAPVPSSCPKCGSNRIKFFGAGIERVASEIKKLYPGANIRLIDSASAKNKGEYEKFYNELKNGTIDIAIGTQILAKGLDIEGIDLVGIISADTGLHMPHYRATEKVFQIISQVSGRSGRKHNAGETIIQSYWPESSPIIHASNHDFINFYDEEISNRQLFNYPPFGKIVHVVSEHIDEKIAQGEIFKVAEKLREKKVIFIGPSPCFYQKLHSKFRYHIIIKTAALPDKNISQIYHEHDNIIWDIDAVNLL